MTTNHRKRPARAPRRGDNRRDHKPENRRAPKPLPPPARAFTALGVPSDLASALAGEGIEEPFPVQKATIPDALAGRDICGMARTGSGKTLAFGVPLVDRAERSRPRHPTALVLVPTRELAAQVVRALVPLAKVRRRWVLGIWGGVPMGAQIRGLAKGADIVVATPGRLIDLLDREEVSVAEVETVVLDEADLMVDMGFLPQVESILDRIEGGHQTLLFSATLDGDVDRLLRKYLHEPVQHNLVPPDATVESLTQRFVGVARHDRLGVAADLCGPGRTLVFVRTKHGADRVAAQLRDAGVAADALHGGLAQGRRNRVLESFRSGQNTVLVATDVAARGIHVDGIDTVLHFDPPEDPKTYLHRSGRTARAGASGLVVTLVLEDQVRAVRRLQRSLGSAHWIERMRPGDPRLGDLVAWEPPEPAPGRNSARGHAATPNSARNRARGARARAKM